MEKITIQLLGGASAIGASATLVRIKNKTFLVDCGIRFRKDQPLPDLDPLSEVDLDAIFITHAHTDHTGALPLVHDIFRNVPVYMTPPTADLVALLLRDALRLMDDGIEREGEIPLYGEKQVQSLFTRILPVHHYETLRFDDIEVRFLPAGHILGASMVHVGSADGSILLTGDYSVFAQRTVPALDMPSLRADVVVTEATYGARLHADRTVAEANLVAKLADVAMEGGRTLIPAFAIGRAQEVLCILARAMREETLPKIPVFVDGMVRQVCDIYARHQRYTTRSIKYAMQRGHPFYTKHIRPVEDAKQRARILAGVDPCIIVASSGMLQGGPSAYYAARLAGNPADAILVTGYQDEESPGARLLRLALGETREGWEVGGAKVDVRCRFESYGLSAHADRMQMCGLVRLLEPSTVVVVHGDEQAKESLAASLDIKDVIRGRDGLLIERTACNSRASLHRRAARTFVPPVEEDIRRLIGVDEGPFRLGALAQSHYGHKLDAQERNFFALALEQSGLLERDDRNRALLRRTRILPEAAAANNDLERVLREENAKGRLWEACQKLRIGAPTLLCVKDNDSSDFAATLTVTLESGEKLTSGGTRGSSKMIAQQLAARALLNKLPCHIEPPAVPAIEPGLPPHEPAQSRPIDLKAPATILNPLPSVENVSSLLNSLAQKKLIGKVTFVLLEASGPSHQPIFNMKAVTTLPDGLCIESLPISSPTKKAAQAQASYDLYQRLRNIPGIVETDQPPCAINVHADNAKGSVPVASEDVLIRVIQMIRDLDANAPSRLPFSYCRTLATRACRLGKEGDEAWLRGEMAVSHIRWLERRRELADQYGYLPFINLDPLSYRYLSTTYPSWVFALLHTSLENPERVFPGWLAQFCAAMVQLGESACCAGHQGMGLHAFVTQSDDFASCVAARGHLADFIRRERSQPY